MSGGAVEKRAGSALSWRARARARLRFARGFAHVPQHLWRNALRVRNALDRLDARFHDRPAERRAKLTNTRFTIVSNDCWGAEVYSDLGLPYQTPLIGTFVLAPCYMKIAADARRILTSPIEFVESSRYEEINERRRADWYPLGRLAEGVEIHFLHYKSIAEAAEKWARRLARTHFDALFFKLSADKDRFTDDDIATFDALPLAKLVLSAKKHPGLASVVRIPEYVLDGKAMYSISLRHFDIVAWLNSAGTAR